MQRKSLVVRSLLFTLVAVLFAFAQANAQCKPEGDQHPPLSPAAVASTTLNGKTLTVYYCTPSMRGRKIMGSLVPYGKVWRTGANTATTIHTQANLRIGGKDVPAGAYSLYSLPSPTGWKLIINKQVGQWGLTYHENQDLARIPMMRGPTPATTVQNFKIAFEHTHGNHTQLHLIWDKTNVYVLITATK
ncbi:MAG TPA: DUF2911 domain-containing protein [Acidobacteriaceae bacterium]|nr:DUF2911 domain-containing protein [Acidobacteriaceae bacterium]